MVYRRFSVIIFLRVLFILINCGVIGWAINKPNLNLSIFTLLILLFLQTWELYYFIVKSNKSLRNFLNNLKDEPSTLDFIEKSDLTAFKGIEGTLRDIVEIIRISRLEKEQNYQYLKNLVDSIGIGIVVWNDSDKVTLHNKAILTILRVSRIAMLNSLNDISSNFVFTINELALGKPKVYTFYQNGEIRNLSLNISIFKINDEKYTILSVEDIGKAVEQTEVAAWKKMISVITHEMVNSITPIKSLSKTIIRSLNRIDTEGYSNEISIKCIDAASAIEERSLGLEGFINSYKSFYKLPDPVKSQINISKLFGTLKLISGEIPKSSKVKIIWNTESNLSINADERLISQVIINIVKNAIEAIGEADGQVIINAINDNYQSVMIVIENNGPQIPTEIQENIFVPFFTTKSLGSGIGLSISRQIMMMHDGGLTLISNTNGKVQFALEFV